MKKPLKYIVIFIIFTAWAVRYLTLNEGHIKSYYYRDVEKYHIGDTVNLDNDSLYISVTDAEMLSSSELCSKYNKSDNDFSINYDMYIEFTLILENQGDEAQNIDFFEFVLRGNDWWQIYDSQVTTYANENCDVEFGEVTGVTLPPNEKCSLKIVYGNFRNSFPLSRWKNFKDETIWLTVISRPIEKRVYIA